MAGGEEIIDELESFHQAAQCRLLAMTHKEDELFEQWSDILCERTVKLLTKLLDRKPTEKEINRIFNPPYPELPYEV